VVYPRLVSPAQDANCTVPSATDTHVDLQPVSDRPAEDAERSSGIDQRSYPHPVVVTLQLEVDRRPIHRWFAVAWLFLAVPKDMKPIFGTVQERLPQTDGECVLRICRVHEYGVLGFGTQQSELAHDFPGTRRVGDDLVIQ
jgi:hypothetical protein